MKRKSQSNRPPRPKCSWNEKLANSKDCPKIAKIEGKLTKRWGTGTFVIPAPLEVDAAMKQIRRGELTTIDAIRKALAKKHRVDDRLPDHDRDIRLDRRPCC